VAAQISIAGTVDTLTTKIGATLLNPSYGKALESGLVDTRFWFGNGDGGLHVYGSLSVIPWGVKGSVGFQDSAQAIVFGLGAAYFYDLMASSPRDSGGRNTVSFTGELGFAIRSLNGDVTNGNHVLIQDRVLGTRRTVFGGPSGGLEIRFNDVVLALQVYSLFGTRHIDGLSKAQVTAALGVQGAFLQFARTSRKRH
jgi:hypothetical protein